MSRIPTPALETATGATAEVYAQLKKSIGGVPNTFAAIGVHGPAVLKAILQAESVLAADTLSKRDHETIKLTVSDASVRRSGRCVLLALGLLAVLVLPAGAHEVYPPGWNVTGATVLEAHPFQPDSNHRHRATSAAPQETAAAPAQVSSLRYQFVPGSNHRHSVQ